MRRWFQNMSYKMQNRYGRDELSLVLSVIALVFILLGLIRPLRFLIYFALAALIWSLIRALSTNSAQRTKELEFYLKCKNSVVNKFKLIKSRFRDRNTHLYVKCPSCKTYIRISKPKRGIRIMITCPKCKNQFEKRT